MSMVVYDDCKSAADVMARARRVVEFRRKSITEARLYAVKTEADYTREFLDKVCATVVVSNDLYVPQILACRAKMSEIQSSVAIQFGITPHDIVSDCRTKKLVPARQLTHALCRLLTLNSFPAIGAKFNRDHTTIIHSNNIMQPIIDKILHLCRTATLDQIVAAAFNEMQKGEK